MEIRILVLTELKEGGEWIATTRLIAALKKRSKRYSFFLLAFKEKSLPDLSVFKNSFLISRSKNPNKFGFLIKLIKDIVTSRKKISEVISTKKIDLIITTDYLLGLSAILTKKTKTVYFFHGTKGGIISKLSDLNYRVVIVKVLEKIAYIFSSAILVPSQTAYEYIKRKIFPFWGIKIFVIPNFASNEFFKKPKDSALLTLRRSVKVKNNAKIILYSGRIAKNKGLENLLLALPAILEKNKKAVLIVAHPSGNIDNNVLARLTEIKSAESLKERVKFVTSLSQKGLINIYYLSDIFVLPSEIEFAPLSIIESLATSTPCVATDVGNIGSLLKKIDNNLILKNNSPEEISKKVNMFFSYPAAKKVAIKTKSRMVSMDYSEEKTIEEFLKVLQFFDL